MSNWFDTIKDNVLVSVTNDNYSVTLTTDKHVVVLHAEGDCCSNSWFEHVDDMGAVGGNITEFTNEGMPEGFVQAPDTEYECLQYYFMTLKTTKGRVHLEMRNSSNGYYGGYIGVDLDGKRVSDYY